MDEPDEIKRQRGIFYSQVMKVSAAFIMYFRGLFGISYHFILAMMEGIKLLNLEMKRRS